MRMLATVYKMACIAAAIVGLVIAFPLMTYAFIMGVANLNNGGVLILLLIAAFVGAAAWAIFRSALPSSFIAPTIAGGIGIVLVLVGLPFAQQAPGY